MLAAGHHTLSFSHDILHTLLDPEYDHVVDLRLLAPAVMFAFAQEMALAFEMVLSVYRGLVQLSGQQRIPIVRYPESVDLLQT